ncbi:MAG: hypothetical protein H6734_27665 [Alphaproteobacteria bacterium]|nr:hypothetical protein [Alphaproteobacteria bacterium]MCB9688115.1 hypothetical protein [Alphaproteobacteria bacterium]
MRAWSWAVVLVGCGGQTGYCIGEVSADDQDEGVTDSVWYNPNAVGTTICGGMEVSKGFCNQHGGTFGNVDDYENGAAPFCEENGFTVDCSPDAGSTGNVDIVTLWVEPGTTCPADPFTSTSDSSL